MRIVLAVVTALAPLLLLYAEPPFAHAALYAGVLVCFIALACGYELAFVTYAIASWAIAAGFLVSQQRLDSPLSSQFADAAYLMTAAAVVIALARAPFVKRRP